MKLTLICMVASMVMLVAQANPIKEDADGLAKIEVRDNDVADANEAELDVEARRLACPWVACCCAKSSEALKLTCGLSGGVLC